MSRVEGPGPQYVGTWVFMIEVQVLGKSMIVRYFGPLAYFMLTVPQIRLSRLYRGLRRSRRRRAWRKDLGRRLQDFGLGL